MTTQWMHAALRALLVTTTGCTLLGDGAGWAEVDGQLDLRLAVDEAHASDGADLRTDQGHDVWLDRLSVQVAGLGLLGPATTTGAAAVAFDPANPPPGYTLCHGGHCHRSDGSIASYEEIQAELAGGGSAGDVRLASLEGGGALILDRAPHLVLPARPLGALTLSGAGVLLAGLEIDARVAIDGQQVPLRVRLAPEHPALARAQRPARGLPLDLGPDGPSRVHLALELVEDGSLFDGVRYQNLARQDGAIVVDATLAANAAAHELWLAKLGVLPCTVVATTP